MPGIQSATSLQELSQELLNSVTTLADQGLFLQAHTMAQSCGDYRDWQSEPAAGVAIRLTRHLGAPRLGRVLCFKGYRRYPNNETLRMRYIQQILLPRGPWQVWDYFRHHQHLMPKQPEEKAEWFSTQAWCHALLFDFKNSHRLHARAMACGSQDPWLKVEYSYILEQEDRYTEALEAVLQVLEQSPDNLGALRQAAWLESLLGLTTEATERLRVAAGRLESGYLCDQLADTLLARQQWDEALYWLQRGEALQPLQEKGGRIWRASRRCDIACQQKAFVEARAWAQIAADTSPFYRTLMPRLQQPKGQRKILAVDFVAQHRMTCAPATLSALTAWWGQPVDQLQIADEICYNGTSQQNERDWCERNGWLTLEFTVDWACSKALIDRGIPFTLSVQLSGLGHMVAVIGYDELQGTLLIRDPSGPLLVEYQADEVLAQQQLFGPRGLLLLPPGEQQRLAGLTPLPEQRLHDLYYQRLQAVRDERPDRVEEALQALQQAAPEHRLTQLAQYFTYSQNNQPQKALAVINKLLERYAHNPILVIYKADVLIYLASYQEQLAWLQQSMERHPGEALLLTRYAALLSVERQRQGEVLQLLRRALRTQPISPETWYELAGYCWSRNDYDYATELYRIAACLQPYEERYPLAYSRALICCGHRHKARQFLWQRYRHLARWSTEPVLTLCEHLEEWNEADLLERILQRQYQHRPDDLAIGLQMAEYYGRRGDLTTSLRCVLQTEPLLRKGRWLYAFILCHLRLQGQGEQQVAGEQLLVWSWQMIAGETLNISAQRLHLQLLEQHQGFPVALQHIEQLVSHYPHYGPLTELQVEYLQRISPPRKVRALERLLRSHPFHMWAKREWISCLVLQGLYSVARIHAEQLLYLDPFNTLSHSVLGYVELHCGRRQDAKSAFRHALYFSIDNTWASGHLLRLSRTLGGERRSLAFIHTELSRQTSTGEGWLAYQQQALAMIPHEELLRQLQEACDKFSELWQLRLALARQLMVLQRYSEAEQVLQQARKRFPLVLSLIQEQATLWRCQGQRAQYRRVLQQEFTAHPLWAPRAYDYAQLLLEQEQTWPQAERLLRQALILAPEESELRAALASSLLRQQQYSQAEEQLRLLLQAEPGHQWGWEMFVDCCRALQQPETPLQFARLLVWQRPRDGEALYALAQQQTEPLHRERLLHESLRYNVIRHDSHDTLLSLLLEAERYEEVHQQIQAPCWHGVPPVALAFYGPLARYRQGEHENAVLQLHELLQRHPWFFNGWHQLADWMEIHHEYAHYVTAAQKMVWLQPHNAIAQGFLGHALRLNHQEEQALPAFQRAFELDPHYVFAGIHAFELLQDKGEHKQCMTYLRQLVAESPTEDVLLRALTYAIDRKEIELQEQVLEPLCTLPELSSCWRSVEEQISQTADNAALHLLEKLGSAIRLHFNALQYWLGLQHNRESAGTLLQEILQREPGYYAGWQALANHMEQKALWWEAIKAAQEMVRLQGDNCISFGYLGHSQRMAGEPEQALESFRHAVELSDEYYFAALQIFELLVQLRRPTAEVSEQIRHLLRQFPHGDLLLRVLPYALDNDLAELQKEILEIACYEEDAEEYWSQLTELLRGRASLLDEVILQGIAEGGLGRTALNDWLQRADQRGGQGLWQAFCQLLPQDHLHYGKFMMLQLLAERHVRGTVKLLQQTVQACREGISENGNIWAMASYALVSHDQYNLMFELLSDWQQRIDLPPWGLNNLAIAMRMVGRNQEARELALLTLERDPEYVDAHVWLAVDAAQAEDHDELLARLQRVAHDEVRLFMKPYYYVLRGYALALQEKESIWA
ncbi:MAG: C39 family peptidase, partial [Enterobacteriaceae bacterium]